MCQKEKASASIFVREQKMNFLSSRLRSVPCKGEMGDLRKIEIFTTKWPQMSSFHIFSPTTSTLSFTSKLELLIEFP